MVWLLVISTAVFIISCKKKTSDPVVDCTNAAYIDSVAKLNIATIHQYASDSSLTIDSTTTGLYYSIIDSGVGANPTTSSYLTVKYKGYTTNGLVFDQTTTTASFYLSNLIYGWQYGLPLIKKSGKIKLIIPARLGYGCNAVGSIPPNSVIIFDVELIDFR